MTEPAKKPRTVRKRSNTQPSRPRARKSTSRHAILDGMPTLHERMQRVASDPIIIAKLAAALIIIAIVAYVFTVYAPRPASGPSWETDAPLTEEQKRAMMESLEQSTDTQGRVLEDARNEQGLTPERRLELIRETSSR